MAKLENIPPKVRKNVEALECPTFSEVPFATPAAPGMRKLALISTAGLIQRGDQPFRGGDNGYRVISDDIPDKDILVSHISVNFSRNAALRDIESMLPRRLASELVTEGLVNSVSSDHYSFMGATDPMAMEETANELAAKMKSDGVNTAVLLPV